MTFFLLKILLTYTYCYLLFSFFFGMSFFSNVFDFALLYVFIVSLRRTSDFECITRFADLKTQRAGSSIVTCSFPDANRDSSFKLPAPTRNHIIDCITEGFDYLVRNKEMIK